MGKQFMSYPLAVVRVNPACRHCAYYFLKRAVDLMHMCAGGALLPHSQEKQARLTFWA